jgi:hypothetical protein
MTRLACLTAIAVVSSAAAVAMPAAGASPHAVAPHPAMTTSQVLVVATDGSDQNPGTAAAPLLRIQTAVDRLPHGGVVELESGHYHQRVRLVGVHGVTVRAYPHAKAVLDGAGLTPARNATSALVTIQDSTDVAVRDLGVTGYRTNHRGTVPIGIYIHGHDDNVRIVGNHVHALGNTNGKLGSFNINAHGIAAYGDDPHGAIRGLVIKDNTVDHLKTGASETVVVNGNVAHWAIVGNHIYDDNNIGIDAIGYEPTLTGKYRYTNRDRARYGRIAHNHIVHIQSRGNPAYWDDGWCNCADGIYVDGGTHIDISHNRVAASDIGIEVAAENGRGTADFNRVTRNHITTSLFTGLATGGYCNDKPACGGVKTGSSHDNYWAYNVLRANNQLNDGSPEVLIQYHSYRDTFVHNTITATNRAHLVLGSVPNADTDGHPIGNTSNHNTFRAIGVGASKAVFGWLGQRYVGFATYQSATGEDQASTYGG